MANSKKRFIVDEQGKRRAIVLPIKEYEELLEDLADLAVIAERADEPTEPLDVVKKRLEEGGRLHRRHHAQRRQRTGMAFSNPSLNVLHFFGDEFFGRRNSWS